MRRTQTLYSRHMINEYITENSYTKTRLKMGKLKSINFMYKIMNNCTHETLWLWYCHFFFKNCIILFIIPISIFQGTCLSFYLHWNYSFTINSKHSETSYLVQHSRNGLPNYLQLELDSCLSIVYNKYTFGNTHI